MKKVIKYPDRIITYYKDYSEVERLSSKEWANKINPCGYVDITGRIYDTPSIHKYRIVSIKDIIVEVGIEREREQDHDLPEGYNYFVIILSRHEKGDHYYWQSTDKSYLTDEEIKESVAAYCLGELDEIKKGIPFIYKFFEKHNLLEEFCENNKCPQFLNKYYNKK